MGACTAIGLLTMPWLSDAFSSFHKGVGTLTANKQFGSKQMVSSLLFMATNEEVERLRAAAAKAREDVDRLSKELGKTTIVGEKTPKQKTLFDDTTKAMLPVNVNDLDKQMNVWNELKNEQMIQNFGIANLRTFPVSLRMFESRTSIKAEQIFAEGPTEVNLDDFKYATLYVTGFSTLAAIASLAILPSNIGPTLCYFFAVLPILFLGIGSSSPVIIANAIAGLKNGNVNDDKKVSMLERRCRHEAAHFCCGYWCGLPISSYTIDEKTGVYQVEFAVSNTANRGYSSTEIAALSITGLAGLVGEILQYQNVVGATEDLSTLDMIYRRSQEFIGAAAQQDLTRWGALSAVLLLRQYNAKYEQIVQAFQQRKPIEECIAILES